MFNSLALDGAKIEEWYSDEYYKERKEHYFDNVIVDSDKGIFNDNIREFQDGLDIILSHKKGGRLLDIGCGIGVFLKIAREKGWDGYGIDISSFAIDYAKNRFGLNVKCGRPVDAAFPDDYFDVVTMWDSIEHFNDPTTELREINRILKKEGIILLNTPNADSLMRMLSDLVYKTSLKRIKYPVKKIYHKYHLYYYSINSIITMLRKTGFEPLQVNRKTIPLVKARASRIEKYLVRALSALEKTFGMEYELFIIARKI